MSFAKYSRQLKRDLKANPKKAVMLVTLCLVCLYVCAPLVFSKEESKKPTGKPSTAVATSPATSTTTPPEPASIDWRELARLLDADMPGLGSIANVGETRNPFAPVEVKRPKPKLAMAAAPPALRATFDALGVSVSSTMVGGKARRAVINGRGFARGAVIAKLQEKDVRLTEVEPWGVTLEWNGLERELKLRRPGEQPAPPPHVATTAANASQPESNTDGFAGAEQATLAAEGDLEAGAESRP